MAKTILIQSNNKGSDIVNEICKKLDLSQVNVTSDKSKPHDLKILINQYSERVSEKFGIVSYKNTDKKISKFIRDVGAKETNQYSPLRFGDFYEDVDIVFILGKNENVFNAKDFAKAIENYAEVKAEIKEKYSEKKVLKNQQDKNTYISNNSFRKRR